MKKLMLGSMLLLLAAAQPMAAEEAPTTLPPAIVALMKSGKKLGKVWMSPKFDVSKGFTIGHVSSEVEGFYADVVGYFPEALSRLTIPGSPNVLSLTVVELKVVERSGLGYETATMGVEGTVVGPDGGLLMAFTTREEISNRENVPADCMGAMDKIVWSLSRDLGKRFQDALEARKPVDTKTKAGAAYLPPPPPSAQEHPLSTNERLLRLDDLKRKGLITQEEYDAHRKEILQGL
jgi:hypothetical protein